SYDAAGHRGECGGVVFPQGQDDLRIIVQAASKRGIKLFVRGAGTGFSGGSVPLDGGLVISTEQMDRVLNLDTVSEEVEVESGIVNRNLQDYLEPLGLFYPPDPASFKFSTIGGNIAENAGGPRAYKYGVTRRYVRSITWVTASGDVLTTPMERLSSLLVGSEGTLGVIYSARLSVVPLPETYRTSFMAVAGDEKALADAASIISTGLCPSVLEYIDSKTMRCVSEYHKINGLDEGSSYLFIEIDGVEKEVEAQYRLLEDVCRRRGVSLRTARNEVEREILWEIRRSISPSLARRGVTKVNEDVSLPLGHLEEAVSFIHDLAGELSLDCYIFGHCGDGNLHVNIMTDRRKKEEMQRVEIFVESLFERVVELGGTLSGEHGIGITKSKYLGLVFSAAELDLQRRLKGAMDGAGLMNPGKYFTM
ncbi:MAG: FAD-binding protein, partial [Candidatus Krumholzibacteria bacterium]|nr:FAD-binding protein [Candidatus Krumholzibacteria bacterium]